jgi:hypothetical protein
MSFSLTTANISFKEWTGLSFSPEVPATYESVRTLLMGVGCNLANPQIALTIEMPCGESYQFPSLWDFPLHDTPCACGDTRHWVVRYEGVIHTIEDLLRDRGDVIHDITPATADEHLDPVLPAADDLPRAATHPGGDPRGR